MIVTDVYPGKDSRHARARDHRVLVVSGFLEASCVEPTDTGSGTVLETVNRVEELKSGRQCRSERTVGTGPLGGKSRWGRHGDFVVLFAPEFQTLLTEPADPHTFVPSLFQRRTRRSAVDAPRRDGTL
jgi:hypothetical protein